MSKTDILVIGTNAEILQTILRLINTNEDWQGIGAISAAEAVSLFTQHACQLVLLGAGLTDAAEDGVCSELRTLNPEIIIVKHYGGGSGLLFAEIKGALGIL